MLSNRKLAIYSAMDLAEVDCLSKFDFTQGFSRFHVVWPLTDVSKPEESPAFTTTIRNGDGAISLVWRLRIIVSDGKLAPVLHLQTRDKMVPVIYRLSFSSAVTKKPFMNGSSFKVFDSQYSVLGIVPDVGLATAPEGEKLFQCWLDIPNTVLESKTRKRKRESSESLPSTSTHSEFKKQNFDSFLTGKIFSGVLNGDNGYSDVTLGISKDGQVIRRFPCHRVILSARSAVFERFFAGNEWKENAENGDRLIEIKDIDQVTMETVLKHIYTAYLPDKLPTFDQLSDLVYAADKYNLSDLKNWCVLVLITHYNADFERIQQLELTDRHSLDQLKAIGISQLSMNIAAWQSQSVLDGIPSQLLSEIVTASAQRQYETKEIILARDDE